MKKKINGRKRTVFLFHERELWWCSIGINVGHEEDGKGSKLLRPVVVFKKLSDDTFWGIPVTSRLQQDQYRVSIDIGDHCKRQAKVSQLRLYDTRRLVCKMGMVGVSDYFYIGKAVMDVSAR